MLDFWPQIFGSFVALLVSLFLLLKKEEIIALALFLLHDSLEKHEVSLFDKWSESFGSLWTRIETLLP